MGFASFSSLDCEIGFSLQKAAVSTKAEFDSAGRAAHAFVTVHSTHPHRASHYYAIGR